MLLLLFAERGEGKGRGGKSEGMDSDGKCARNQKKNLERSHSRYATGVNGVYIRNLLLLVQLLLLLL